MFLDLPNELLFKILLHLPHDDILNCMETCHQLRSLINTLSFWSKKIKTVLNSDEVYTILLKNIDCTLDSLRYTSFLLDPKSGNLIKNVGLRNPWDIMVGPFRKSSDNVNIIETSFSKFLRRQHLSFAPITLSKTLCSQITVKLVWCVSVFGYSGYPSVYSARLIDRCNTIISNLACIKVNATDEWLELSNCVVLKESVDFSQVYYKEQGYGMRCDGEFKGVKIHNPRIYLEFFKR